MERQYIVQEFDNIASLVRDVRSPVFYQCGHSAKPPEALFIRRNVPNSLQLLIIGSKEAQGEKGRQHIQALFSWPDVFFVAVIVLLSCLRNAW